MQTYTNNLEARINNNNEIKALKTQNKSLIIEALQIVDKMINEEEVVNNHFKDLNRKDKAKFILSYKVDNKDSVVKTVLNYKSNNLTIHYNMTLSALNDCFKFYNDGIISKSAFKDEEKLTKALKSARKEREIERCKKVVNDNK